MMGWFPSAEEIEEEAVNFEELSFFKKTKNVLTVFILVTVALSLLFMGPIEEAVGSGAIYELAFSVVLAGFIYLNHRWAMILFCIIYVANKIIFIFLGIGTPISSIIFGAIALMLTYTSVRVASSLKREKSGA